jgi:HK97 family phage major capsid protein
MSQRLKELSEKRGGKLKEALQIVNVAREAKRELTAEELGKVDTLHNEAESIASTIMAEARQVSLESSRPVALSHGESKDLERFDIGRLLRCMVNGRPLDGVELELTQEGDREARESGVSEVRGFMLPRSFVKRQIRNDMTATTGTNLQYGGQTIATEKAGFFDAFYNGLVLRSAGAMVMEGLTGNLDLPRFVAPGDPAHKTENGTADELTPQTATLSLTPRRLPAFINISEQLMRQSATNIEEWVRRNISMQMSAVAEAAFINGGGTTVPVGILNTVGIGSVVGGTNGATPDWADIVDLETAVGVANAEVGALRYLTNTKVRGFLKKTVRVSSTDSRFIWDGADLNGYSPLITNAVPSNLAKGSSGNVCSAIIFGNFNDFVMGFWGGMSVELLRDVASAKDGKYVLVLNSYYDGGVVRPASFAAMKDAKTA